MTSNEAIGFAIAQTVWTICLGTALAALLAVGFALWLKRHVTARVVRMATSVRHLAARDYGFICRMPRRLTRSATWPARWKNVAPA